MWVCVCEGGWGVIKPIQLLVLTSGTCCYVTSKKIITAEYTLLSFLRTCRKWPKNEIGFWYFRWRILRGAWCDSVPMDWKMITLWCTHDTLTYLYNSSKPCMARTTWTAHVLDHVGSCRLILKTHATWCKRLSFIAWLSARLARNISCFNHVAFWLLYHCPSHQTAMRSTCIATCLLLHHSSHRELPRLKDLNC